MILDMVWDKEKVYLFTGGVDMKVRSWMAEIGSEAKVFEGATRSVCFLLVRGNIRKCSWFINQRYWFRLNRLSFSLKISVSSKELNFSQLLAI